EDVRTRDHPVIGVIAPVTAERADDHVVPVLAAPVRRADLPAPAPGPAGSFDDLMHPLVAEAQRLGDLAERAAGDLEPAHRPAELGAGDLDVALRVDEPRLGGAGLVEKLTIYRHSVYCT